MTESKQLNMIQALNDALDLYMEREEAAVIFGEDVGLFGGVFRVTQGLQETQEPYRARVPARHLHLHCGPPPRDAHAWRIQRGCQLLRQIPDGRNARANRRQHPELNPAWRHRSACHSRPYLVLRQHCLDTICLKLNLVAHKLQ